MTGQPLACAPQADSDCWIAAYHAVKAGRSAPPAAVGGLLQPEQAPAIGPMSDEDREAAIVAAGQQMEGWYAQWERDGCFAARGAAGFWRCRMEDLVRGRSGEQVARMQQERGLL